MKLIVLFISLILSFRSFSQVTKSDTIRALQEIVKEGNCISMPGVGYASEPSLPWYASAFLISLLTVDELFEMTKDTNGGLRLCAFVGLVYHKYRDLNSVRTLLSSDTTTILSIEGCVIDRTTVGYAVNHIEQWNAVIPMQYLFEKMSIEKGYRKRLFGALIHSRKIKPYT